MYHPNPNPSLAYKKAAFNLVTIISYVLYIGISIELQHVCDIGSFWGLFPTEWNSIVNFEFDKSYGKEDEPVVNFKNFVKIYVEAYWIYLLNQLTGTAFSLGNTRIWSID